MSLEQALIQNTDAIERLIGIFSRLYADEASITAQAYREAKAIEVEPAPVKPAPATITVEATPAPAAVSYEQARAHIAALPREQALAILARLGVKRLSDLDPSRFSEVLANA
jgi:hypothetical protein